MATAEQTMMKVQRLLTGPLGLKILLAGESIRVQFEGSSAAIDIRVRDWAKDQEGQPQSLLLITSLILHAVTPTPELFEWVGRHGGSRWFGHVEVHDDSDDPGKVLLIMSHTLLGDYLDEKELQTGMFGVLVAADEWDDELQKRFGGKRWIDG